MRLLSSGIGVLCLVAAAGAQLQLDVSGVFPVAQGGGVVYGEHTVDVQVCAQGVLSADRAPFQRSVLAQLQTTLRNEVSTAFPKATQSIVLLVWGV